MIELLTENHLDRILDLFDSASRRISIISPFLTYSMAETLCKTADLGKLDCSFITRLYVEDLLARANSLDALELMLDHGVKIYLVNRLHTKLYLFDDSEAILGSANFTNGGFKSNIELSLLVSNEPILLQEMDAYF